MKIRLFFLGLVLVNTSLAQGQDPEHQPTSIIPTIGFGTSTVVGKNVNEFLTLETPQFGVIVNHQINDHWGIRSGLSQVNMGVADQTSSIRFSYLAVPVDIIRKFGKLKKCRVNVGLTPGYLARAKFSYPDNSVSYIESSYRRIQLAISYGLGYQITMSDKFGILLETQGLFGLSSIFKIEDQVDPIVNVGQSINIGGIFRL